VPGNHDYYTHAVGKSGLFERYFGPWLAGETVDATATRSPAASARLADRAEQQLPRPFFTYGAGASVGRAQLERLKTLCGGSRPARGSSSRITRSAAPMVRWSAARTVCSTTAAC